METLIKMNNQTHISSIKDYMKFHLICIFAYIGSVTAQRMKFLIKDFFTKSTKSAGNCGFGHIYCRILNGRLPCLRCEYGHTKAFISPKTSLKWQCLDQNKTLYSYLLHVMIMIQTLLPS